MPGTNLTRDEAATRAALLDVTAYTVDLDLTSATQPEATTFVSTTTLEFTCREPGAGTFADLVAPTVREITLNGRSLDPATAYADSRIALDDLEETNTLVVTADCAYSNTGEGLHRFVDPADDKVYLYSQFEVPDARRVFTTFEQPDLKAVFTFNVTAPSHWVVVSNAATPEPAQDEQSGASTLALPHHQADVDLHHRDRGRGVPRRVRHLRGQVRHHPARPLLPPVAQGAHGHGRAGQAHQAELRVVRGAVRLPLPVREVRPALRPRVQRRGDGERRLRDAARRVPPPQPPAALVLRVPRLGHHPRDGPHVVRRPRHHEVVGRPLAQRVVRRVGLLLVRGQRHRVRRRVDRLRQRPQADRLPRRPAALDAPDRGRQRRPARGRGQLRHDHLRQGRLGAQAARRVGRHRALPGGPAQLLQGVGVRQPGVQGPARHPGEVVGP